MKKKSISGEKERTRKSVNFMIDEEEFLAHQNHSSNTKLNNEHNMKMLLKKDISPSSILKRKRQDNLLEIGSNHSDDASK